MKVDQLALKRRYGKRQVVLVNELDQERGVADLIEAHRDGGKKHRALSLCLWRKGEMGREWLMQQRASEKPIFPNLWANTCCYNLSPGEGYFEAAVKRVKEELGIELDRKMLRIVGRFSYFAADKDGWCENEVDTVLVGEWDGEVNLNPDEVQDWRWIDEESLNRWMQEKPYEFAPWFFRVWEIVLST